MDIILAHLAGDYLVQSDWMAQQKTQRWLPAWLHALSYGVCYLFITRSLLALAVIVISHAVIDHYRLARHVVYVKNFLAPRCYWYKWRECDETGYNKDRPVWMAVWLMIIADNTLHLLINTLAVELL